jgi:hypothetical protein
MMYLTSDSRILDDGFYTKRNLMRTASPSPYGRQVGASIVALLRLFQPRIPDAESNLQVLNLALSKDWSQANQVRAQVRDRYLRAHKASDKLRSAQYCFEESCSETLYNDTMPNDPFDAISPYWVLPNAIDLARLLSIPIDDVVAAMRPTSW